VGGVDGGPGELGKFVTDFHFARGVTALQIRGGYSDFGGTSGPAKANRSFGMSWYVIVSGTCSPSDGRRRRCDVLSHQQRLDGDDASIDVTFRLTKQLFEHQIDFDYLDEQVLTTVGTLEGGGLKNLSGQVYRGIIVPSSTVITRAALDGCAHLPPRAGSGLVGRTPTQVIERTFRKPAPDRLI